MAKKVAPVLSLVFSDGANMCTDNCCVVVGSWGWLNYKCKYIMLLDLCEEEHYYTKSA